jgi:hypothetical protein
MAIADVALLAAVGSALISCSCLGYVIWISRRI